MARKKRDVIVLVAALIVLPWVAMSSGMLQAQSPPPRRQPTYQYVGVDQTIARVEVETGRVEILAKKGETRASLLIPDRRPWRWREVPIDEKRPQKRGDPRIRPQVESGPADDGDASEDGGYDEIGG